MDFIKNKILVKEVIGPILVVTLSIILYRIIKQILRKFIDLRSTKIDAKRRKTLYYLFKSIIKILFIAVDILIILEIFGFDTKTIITSLYPHSSKLPGSLFL